MKKIAVLSLLWALMVVAGCETAKGAGKDIQNTGENIREGVEEIESSN